MKYVLFSLLIGFAFVSNFVYAITQEELLTYIKSGRNSASIPTGTQVGQVDILNFFKVPSNLKKLYPDINEEDEFYLTLKEGQSLDEYLNAIKAENNRRLAAGQTNLLPDPTTQINPIAQPYVEPQEAPQQNLDAFGRDLGRNNGLPSIKTPTNVDVLDTIVPPSKLGSLFDNPLNILLNQLFYIGLIAAVILAIVMIIRGGIEYMTIDAIASKENGKNRVKAALGGLVLAFSAILILNTINPGLTSLKITFEEIKRIASLAVDSGLVSGTRPGAGTLTSTGGNFGSWEEYAAEDWVNGLPNGVRSTDGRLVLTTYSATGDAITDSNTAARRGNKNNLLREGSVALSPDLINQYNPAHGSEVFINGISVGFYEDATASEYKGVQFRNTVDVYDENQTLGTKLKNVPAGQWNITFGNPRPQISNP